jgi:SAM-dependent methyltransferase
MELEERIAKLEAQIKLVETYSVAGFWQAMDRAYDMSLPIREIKCIVCDHEDGRNGFRIHLDECMFGGGKLERYQCPKCEAIFGAQKYLDLDETFVSTDYAMLYSRYSESDSTNNEIRTFNSIKPNRSSLYLDWGCGGAWSKTVKTLRDEGYAVYGYEPTVDASTEAIVKTRGEISAKFDGIFSNNVIEHFRDPVSQFRDFHGILKDDGTMAHSSPCYEYRYGFTRFHTLFLLGKSPHILAERTGFKVIDLTKDGEYMNCRFAKV